MDKVFFSFNGNDFSNFVSFVKSMSSRDKLKGGNAALLSVCDDCLMCKAIDDNSNSIEYKVELYEHSDGVIEPVAISINDLSALIKCVSGDKFSIRKQFGQYEFNIIGNGWLPFKTIDVDIDKFTNKDNEIEIGKINSIKLRNAISSVLGYTQEYTYARDRYLKFTNNQMSVTSRLSSVVTKDNFIDIVLHRDDAALLKSLIKDDFDLIIYKIESSVEKLMFEGPNFKLTFIAVDIDTNDVSYIDNINGYVTVSCDDLYKIAVFSEEYSASKHVIGISIKDNKLNLNIKNILASKQNAAITSSYSGNVSDTKEVDVPTHNLLKAIKLFQDKRSRSINIYFTNDLLSNQNCIILFDDNTQARINIYNR